MIFNSRKIFKGEGARILFVTFFILLLYISDLFAVPSTYEKIQELEKMERTLPPERIERPVVQYNSENLRDPFQKTIVRTETGPEGRRVEGSGASETSTSEVSGTPLPPLNVQGIVWGGVFPQAIINNKVVKAGDTIKTGFGAEEISIISIDKDGVTVSFGEKQYRLSSPAAGGSPSKTP